MRLLFEADGDGGCFPCGVRGEVAVVGPDVDAGGFEQDIKEVVEVDHCVAVSM